MQYILGEWDFRQLTLKLKPPVFIPRPETEMLVDLILKEIDSSNTSKVLELCCGSGAISLSLLYERPSVSIFTSFRTIFGLNGTGTLRAAPDLSFC